MSQLGDELSSSGEPFVGYHENVCGPSVFKYLANTRFELAPV